MATGVAWTETGGEVLFVEALKMKGKGGLQLTGLFGNVMKESAQAALSYARVHTKDLEIDNRIFGTNDFHIHIPEGAIPKDGPSAGITMATALISLCTDRMVRWDTAMTGEITLQGNVLPIGGVKEKVLAAQRAGIKRMILPAPNKKDLIDIPKVVETGNGVHLRRGYPPGAGRGPGQTGEEGKTVYLKRNEPTKANSAGPV